MVQYPKTWITAAFISGILLTLGFKDFYPDLERRFRRRRRENANCLATLDSGLSRHVSLDDHERRIQARPQIPEGIERTIGNTPLFKIKSLSEATSCDILAKAEVVP